MIGGIFPSIPVPATLKAKPKEKVKRGKRFKKRREDALEKYFRELEDFEMSILNVYKSVVFCSNCYLRTELKIPKGNFVVDTRCPRCGTKSLRLDQPKITF